MIVYLFNDRPVDLFNMLPERMGSLCFVRAVAARVRILARMIAHVGTQRFVAREFALTARMRARKQEPFAGMQPLVPYERSIVDFQSTDAAFYLYIVELASNICRIWLYLSDRCRRWRNFLGSRGFEDLCKDLEAHRFDNFLCGHICCNLLTKECECLLARRRNHRRQLQHHESVAVQLLAACGLHKLAGQHRKAQVVVGIRGIGKRSVRSWRQDCVVDTEHFNMKHARHVPWRRTCA